MQTSELVFSLSRRRCWLAPSLALGLAALGAPAPATAQATTLTVAVDLSLAGPMDEVARAFAARRAGLRVALVPGEPGALLAQMAQPGSAIDVLAGADAETAAYGRQRRLLGPAPDLVFAGNTLVLVVPAALAVPVQRLADLARPELARIAIGRVNTVAVGRYAREAINAQRLWPLVQRKLVQVGSAAEVLALVKAAEVEAGFVYGSDAAAAGAAVRVVETLATTTPLRYSAATAAASRQAALAEPFVAHLRSEAAREVWRRAGLMLV